MPRSDTMPRTMDRTPLPEADPFGHALLDGLGRFDAVPFDRRPERRTRQRRAHPALEDLRPHVGHEARPGAIGDPASDAPARITGDAHRLDLGATEDRSRIGVEAGELCLHRRHQLPVPVLLSEPRLHRLRLQSVRREQVVFQPEQLPLDLKPHHLIGSEHSLRHGDLAMQQVPLALLDDVEDGGHGLLAGDGVRASSRPFGSGVP
jgi:hypothetical protein